MDRNTIVGFILIGLVLMIWMWMNAPPPSQQKPVSATDSLAAKKIQIDSLRTAPISPTIAKIGEETMGKYFSHLTQGEEKVVEIQTNKYRTRISTKGGSIQMWEMINFKTWDQQPVNLVNSLKGGDFNLLFYSSDGKLINTKNLYFDLKYANSSVVSLGKQDSFKIEFVLDVTEKSRIIKALTFYGDRYSFDADYRFEDMEKILSNFEYQVTWESGLRYAEYNSIDESNSAMAYAYSGGELAEIDANKFNEPVKQNITGRVAWIATKNKYFALAIIPRSKESQGAYLEGVRIQAPDNGAKENYNLALKMPFQGNELETDRFTVFLGPLDFDVVKSYNIGLDQIMSLGAAWIIRPISEYVIIPLFQFLRLFIPNYGFVLVVFSIIIKIVLYPLTRSSMKSMQKMQALQPMMTEMKEKYKDDPQKMNQQVMRLYKEYGVNPAGGCLPLILQLPILYALWAVFRSTIELRQASFILWIHDLSIPDVITKLPFRIPIFGVDEISGLALLMGITMFVQQKMSVKDPRQKMMIWMMPVMMTLLFNSFPSGLNLYYFIFNLLSIGQQAWMNKQHKNEPLRKVEEKKKVGGIMSKITKDLPKFKK
jgi:YidC/Oxa1 family membrane protein insertase